MSLDIAANAAQNIAGGVTDIPGNVMGAMTYTTKEDVFLMACTLWLGWSMFPRPPRVVQRLFADEKKGEYLKWLSCLALVYQGGGRQDTGQSVLAVLAMYALRQTLDMYVQ